MNNNERESIKDFLSALYGAVENFDDIRKEVESLSNEEVEMISSEFHKSFADEEE